MVQKVHVSIVLDRSGSMEDARFEAVGAVNRYIRRMREDDEIAARLSVVTFDNQSIDTIRDRVPIEACPDVLVDEYLPRGATPLLDAVGYSVGMLDCLSERGERRILSIVTDGLDNSSREFTRERLKNLLERKQREDGWLVLYLGAGHDSWSQARQIGISASHTADFSLSAIGEAATVLSDVGRRFLSQPEGPAGAMASRLTADERLRLIGGVQGPRRGVLAR